MGDSVELRGLLPNTAELKMSLLSFTKMLSCLSSSDPESNMAASGLSCSSVSSLLSACLPALGGDINSLLVTSKLSCSNVKVKSFASGNM